METTLEVLSLVITISILIMSYIYEMDISYEWKVTFHNSLF